MTMAKGLSSGYAPVGGVMCRPHVMAAFEGDNKLSHLLTYGGHAVACAITHRSAMCAGSACWPESSWSATGKRARKFPATPSNT